MQDLDHIGRDSVFHCTNCHHHHCEVRGCGHICHRCGCKEYKRPKKKSKERTEHRLKVQRR